MLNFHKNKKEFLSQLESDLKPILRQKDFEEFDFEKTWKWLKTIERKFYLRKKRNSR